MSLYAAQFRTVDVNLPLTEPPAVGQAVTTKEGAVIWTVTATTADAVDLEANLTRGGRRTRNAVPLRLVTWVGEKR